MTSKPAIQRPRNGYRDQCIGSYRNGSPIPYHCQPSILDESLVLVYAHDGDVTTHVYLVYREYARDCCKWYEQITLIERDHANVECKVLEPNRGIARVIDEAHTEICTLVEPLRARTDDDGEEADNIEDAYTEALEYVRRGHYALALDALSDAAQEERKHGWAVAERTIDTVRRLRDQFPTTLTKEA